MTAAVAQLALVLHAHLPYVRQPDQERALEENWLHEAIADCYLPLLEVLTAAEARGGRLRLSLSLSPTLLTMLADPSLPARFRAYLDRRERLCVAERRRQTDPGRRALLSWYQEVIETRREQFFARLGGDLIAAWVRLHDAGRVELLTTAATHGLAPLLRDQPGAVPAQLRVGRAAFQALTGRVPAGLWLPECGYYPGLEREIAAAGYAYSLVETHGLAQGQPAPAWGVQAPVDGGGVAFFGRDPASAAEVWSPTRGYPGHQDYREYHADLGLAGDGADLKDFLPPGVSAGPTGLGYYRVTGGPGPKAPYEPAPAARQAVADARHFISRRLAYAAGWAEASRQAEAAQWVEAVSRADAAYWDGADHRTDAAHWIEADRRTDAAHWIEAACQADATRRSGAAISRPPLTVAPYDAELFGHWWYEGPLFLAALGHELDACPALEAVTLGRHLRDHGCAGTCRLAPSTWGEAGYNGTWLRPETAWVHLQLRQAAEEFQELRQRFQDQPASSPAGRLLRQAARSLLLAQGSDWTFHLGRSRGSDFAQRQLQAQLARFAFLTSALRRGPSPGAREIGLEGLEGQVGQGGGREQVVQGVQGVQGARKSKAPQGSRPSQDAPAILSDLKSWQSGVNRGDQEPGWPSAVLETLAALERLDAIFPDLDPAHFA